MLNTKDLAFKKQPAKKLVDCLYIINKIVSTNIVKLQLLTLMRIHPVMNVSWVVWYKEQVKGQKVEKIKPVKVKEVKKQEIEKILNRRKVREVVKYLVRWKGFIIEYGSQERKEDLENTKKVVAEFKGRVNPEVRKQERLDRAEKKDFRRGKLLGKYMEKILYGWNNGKFENKYLRKLKKNWKK